MKNKYVFALLLESFVFAQYNSLIYLYIYSKSEKNNVL